MIRVGEGGGVGGRVADWVEGASILSMERDRPPGGKSLLETVGKAKPAAARRTRRELLCAWFRTVDSVGDGRHFAKAGRYFARLELDVRRIVYDGTRFEPRRRPLSLLIYELRSLCECYDRVWELSHMVFGGMRNSWSRTH